MIKAINHQNKEGYIFQKAEIQQLVASMEQLKECSDKTASTINLLINILNRSLENG